MALAAAGLACAAEPAPVAGTPFAEESYWAPVLTYPRPGSLHGLFNLNATNQDVTPHGLLLENQGLMLQPLLVLFTPLYADPTQWLTSLTISAGAWASWHSREGGTQPAHWREVDGFAGLTAVLDRHWQLSAFGSTYLSQTGSYPTAWDGALALTYDDTSLLGGAALHPFVELRRQLHGSTTMAFVAANAAESFSWRLGFIPQHQFAHCKLEFPAFLTLVPAGFFQDSSGQPAAAGIGFVSSAAKVTVPVACLSSSTIGTSVYASAQYYRIANPGLLDVNQALGASSRRNKDLLQLHLGMSVNF